MATNYAELMNTKFYLLKDSLKSVFGHIIMEPFYCDMQLNVHERTEIIQWICMHSYIITFKNNFEFLSIFYSFIYMYDNNVHKKNTYM